MLNIWSVNTGYSLGTLNERTVFKDLGTNLDRRIPLPLVAGADLTNITFTVISGSLPAGLRLSGTYIIGSTYEVIRTTVSTFVIRASNTITGEIADRTLNITVEGADAPVWITPGADPDRIIYDFDPFQQYQVGDVIRYLNVLYLVVRPVEYRDGLEFWAPLDPVRQRLTPYYKLFVESSGTLPVGAIPQRMSSVVSASRYNNIVTLVTEEPHSFVFGNFVNIITSDLEINKENVELLRPPFQGVETAEEYIIRVANTLTYRDVGPNFTSTAISGTATLVKSPLAFVLDGTYIDFQLQATDTDLRAGDELEFFIEENSGSLPPGLSMDRTGHITGLIDPILSLDISARDGSFDVNDYDAYPYDFAVLQNISDPNWQQVQTPKKLNRFYEFIVTVTDGETMSRRTFQIYVVGDDFLRADNTIMQIGDGTYTADGTYLRSPIWLTASYLGVKRANNYVTLILDTYDPNPAIGPVDYRLEKFNSDGSISELPPGLALDTTNAEIFGFVPYQPAVTTTYTFTLAATKYDKENIEAVDVSVVSSETQPIGQNYLKINKLPVEDQLLIVNDNIRIGAYVYKINSYEVTELGYDIIRLNKPLQNVVIKGFVITNTYYRTLSQLYTTRTSYKTFTVQVLGEVDSFIRWITPSDLGSVRANLSSQLEVQAVTVVDGAVLTYAKTSGTLPPGIELRSNGELIGRVTQFGNITYRSFWKGNTAYQINDVVKYKTVTGTAPNQTITVQLYKCNFAHTSGLNFNSTNWDKYTFSDNITGLTTYDGRTTTFDNRTGTQDRSYRFTILAQDQFKYSAISRTFTVFVEDPDVKLFSNIYVKPFPTLAKRNQFYSFVNDLDIFTESKIYRSSDPDFGVQKELKMLIYAGIETLSIKNYVPALAMNTKRKRFRVGNPKKAVAKLPGSNTVIYEVIYLEIFDEYEIDKNSVARRIKLPTSSTAKVITNRTNINPATGPLGTVNTVTGEVSYTNTQVRDSLNFDAVDRYRIQNNNVKADTTAVKASGTDIEYIYPSSVTNIRSNIRELMLYEYYTCITSHSSGTKFNKTVWQKSDSIINNALEWRKNTDYVIGNVVKVQTRQIDTENSFLPPWMLTPQNSRTAATGYIKAVPLCYCKAGEADYILENIANSGFDFTNLDFEIDRFIIDAVSGNNEDQYLVIPTYKYNV